MELIKFGHSTIAMQAPEGRILIDPGSATDSACSQDADAVLLTHIHPDHFDVDAVKASGLPVWGPQDVADKLGETKGDCTVVESGDEFEVLGLRIRAVGGRHHPIHPEVPRPVNLGYLAEGVLHPGDEFITELPGEVRTLLLPIAGPWARSTEAADYARELSPEMVVPIHDAVLSEFGQNFTDNVLGNKLALPGYFRPELGQPFEAK
ncbi:MBL fold metallo-hydrolase [Corynebacterium camporealensis]